VSKEIIMKLKILKTKKDYLAALERFEKIFQAKPGSGESDEADVLSLLLKEYEEKNFDIEAPSPIEAIKYRMEQQGLTNKDLAVILGYKSRVTDIFKKHRKLNLIMVRKLHRELNIPLKTLIKEY
jgi:HTH-type transcriptional regulator/antitoxin HigA